MNTVNDVNEKKVTITIDSGSSTDWPTVRNSWTQRGKIITLKTRNETTQSMNLRVADKLPQPVLEAFVRSKRTTASRKVKFLDLSHKDSGNYCSSAFCQIVARNDWNPVEMSQNWTSHATCKVPPTSKNAPRVAVMQNPCDHSKKFSHLRPSTSSEADVHVTQSPCQIERRHRHQRLVACDSTNYQHSVRILQTCHMQIFIFANNSCCLLSSPSAHAEVCKTRK